MFNPFSLFSFFLSIIFFSGSESKESCLRIYGMNSQQYPSLSGFLRSLKLEVMHWLRCLRTYDARRGEEGFRGQCSHVIHKKTKVFFCVIMQVDEESKWGFSLARSVWILFIMEKPPWASYLQFRSLLLNVFFFSCLIHKCSSGNIRNILVNDKEILLCSMCGLTVDLAAST